MAADPAHQKVGNDIGQDDRDDASGGGTTDVAVFLENAIAVAKRKNDPAALRASVDARLALGDFAFDLTEIDRMEAERAAEQPVPVVAPVVTTEADPAE